MVSRYNEIFFIIDTCQASSMYEKFYSPNILATASSLVGEDSLSVSSFYNFCHTVSYVIISIDTFMNFLLKDQLIICYSIMWTRQLGST